MDPDEILMRKSVTRSAGAKKETMDDAPKADRIKRLITGLCQVVGVELTSTKDQERWNGIEREATAGREGPEKIGLSSSCSEMEAKERV